MEKQLYKRVNPIDTRQMAVVAAFNGSRGNSVYSMKNLIKYWALILVCTTLSVDAYRHVRNLGRRRPRSTATSFNVDYPPYQGPSQHPPFHEQHQPFREQSYRMHPFKSYRQAGPIRHRVLRDQSLFRDYPSFKSQSYYRDQPFRDGVSFKDVPDFKGDLPYDQALSSFRSQLPFRDQQVMPPSRMPFRDQESLSFGAEQQYRPTPPHFFEGQAANLTNGQSDSQAPFKEQTSYRELEQQEFRDDPQSYSESISPYQGQMYDKPMDSYREQERQAMSFANRANYLKYGNHGLGFASIPSMSSYDSPLPLTGDGTTTEPTNTATTKSLLQQTASTMTSASTDNHSPSATIANLAGSISSTTTQMKAHTLADVSATSSTPSTLMVPTMASLSATPKQASNLDQNTKLMPTGSSSIPMEITKTMITAFDMKPNLSNVTPAPVNMVTNGFYIPGALKNNIQDSALNYLLLSQGGKQDLNNNVRSYLNYILPQESKQSLNNNLQGLNGNLQTLNNNLQGGLLKYMFSEEPKNGLSMQPLDQSGSLNYRPLTLGTRAKFTLPLSLSSLSSISRPLQTLNYLPSTMPRMSFVSPSSSALSSASTGLSLGIPNSLTASIQGALPGSMSGGISAGIPGSMSESIPASIPLSFGQSFQHAEQMQQFGEARSQPYGTGLQLQLGGFDGLDYALQSSNPASRPMELGISKVGLSLSELQRSHVPAFAKLGFGQHLW